MFDKLYRNSAFPQAGVSVTPALDRPLKPVWRWTAGAVLGLAFGACIHVPAASVHAAALPTASQSADANDSASHGDVPDNELDARTLYQLILSEIAAQRGMPDVAFVTEYNLAKELRDPRLARRATEFALMARLSPGALQSARLWAELSPDSEEAKGTELTILVVSNRLDEAEPLIRELLSKSPSKAIGFAQLQSTLSRSPNRQAASALMDKIAADYPNVPEAHLAVAQMAQAAGNGQHALQEARLAATMWPDLESPAILAAQYAQTEAPKEAEQFLTNFLKHSPKSAAVRTAYARLLVNQKRYDEASTQFEVLLKNHPNDTETIYTLGLLAYQAERPGSAESYFKHFIEIRNKEDVQADEQGDEEANDTGPKGHSISSAYLYLAQISEDRKDYKEALDYLGQIDDGDDYLSARIRRAFILSRIGQIDAARQELHDTVAHNDHEHTQLVLSEAQLLRDKGQDQEALDLLTHALEASPGDPDLMYDVGMTAERLNRLDLMESTLRALIKNHPEYAQAYNALGYTLADRNIRLDEAHQLIEKALSLAPDDASIIDSMGWVQYRQGHLAQAIQYLQRAYALRGDAEIAVHLGEVLWVSGKHSEAEKYWKEAIRKEPENEVLHQTLSRFSISVGSL